MDWQELGSRLQHVLQGHLQSGSKQLSLAFKSPLIWGSEQSLPVAGLDALSGQSVLYSLRNSLSEVRKQSSATPAVLVLRLLLPANTYILAQQSPPA
jgi:hypothetical protein